MNDPMSVAREAMVFQDAQRRNGRVVLASEAVGHVIEGKNIRAGKAPLSPSFVAAEAQNYQDKMRGLGIRVSTPEAVDHVTAEFSK